MKINLIKITARCVVFELENTGKYFSDEAVGISLNGEKIYTTGKVVNTLSNLKPSMQYTLEAVTTGGLKDTVSFKTEDEFVTLNVKAFGALGDGINDDTAFIQAAIMAAPKNSRVLIPAGRYLVTSLFLKDDLNLEIAENAELICSKDRLAHPYFPGVIQSYDEKNELILGTWEGNPRPMYSGLITGINVKNVCVYGKGTINGNASKEDWWKNPKKLDTAYRPRAFFVSGCEDVCLMGLNIKNSPSWTIHPFFSKRLEFLDLSIENPSDSPNTDGLDPESCRDVKIIGVRFTLGDDCIAIKSGKIYMGKKYKTPSENIVIRQCLMENGHGAVTIGSEMAGGVKNLTVKDCLFNRTDRGLRIKTRRGRGEDAVLSDITFSNIKMDNVMTPFVVNCFYFCDPDGKTEYVQSRAVMPVDERTPYIKRLTFENIEAHDCHVAAAYFEGLPEQKIEEIIINNVHVDYSKHPKCDVPAMSSGVEPRCRAGLFASNVKKMKIKELVIEGCEGQMETFRAVDEVIR